TPPGKAPGPETRRRESSFRLPCRGSYEPQPRRELRHAHLGEKPAVDEEDRDRVPPAARQLVIRVDVDEFPAIGVGCEHPIRLGPHLVAQMTPRAREQAELDHGLAATGVADSRATRKR